MRIKSVRPILTYVAETRIETSKTKKNVKGGRNEDVEGNQRSQLAVRKS